MKSVSVKMIILGVTVACYFIPIILSCAIYFALIVKKRKIQENNILEENLNQITTTKVSLKHSSIVGMEVKPENHFEIPGIVINASTNESFQNKALNQNRQSQQSKAAFRHLILLFYTLQLF